MRMLAVLYSVLVLSALGFSQTVSSQNWRGVPGFCPYGCAPYVPMLTTPMLSFATVSPDPAGATDATGGLVVGATNSTLSAVTGGTDAVYTIPVWYAGGQTPLTAPASGELENGFARARERKTRRLPYLPEAEEGAQAPRATTPQAWIYFSAAERTAQPGEAAGAEKRAPATRTYSNDDVERQNQQNGLVKYDSKTEKLQ